MIQALIAGERNAGRMADLAQRRMRLKIPRLTEALIGRFNEHHAFLARVHLDLIDQHTAVIDQLTERVEVMMEPFRGFHALICTIPGISTRTADVVVAETGADMSVSRPRSTSHAGPVRLREQRNCRQGEVQPNRPG
jgi:transposase